MKCKIYLPLLAAALLASCATMQTELSVQIDPVPGEWRSPLQQEQTGGHDQAYSAELHELIQQALEYHPDIRHARANLDEALALEEVARVRRLPQIGWSGRAQYNGRNSADQRTASAGLNLQWDADIGRQQYSRFQAAKLETMARRATLSHTKKQMIRTVATAYLDYRHARLAVALAERSLTIQTSLTDLAMRRVDAGLAPRADLTRARADLQSAQAELHALIGQKRQALLTVSIAVGLRNDVILDRENVGDDLVNIISLPAIDLPADTIRRRSDIQQAELELLRTLVEGGIAQGDYWPGLSFPVELQLDLTHPAQLAQSIVLSVGLELSQTIYDGGLRDSELKVAEAQLDKALSVYEGVVTQALGEVEQTLSALKNLMATLDALRIAANTRIDAYEDVALLNREGLVSFQELLSAQRDLVAAERAVLDQSLLVVQTRLSLHLDLGLLSFGA